MEIESSWKCSLPQRIIADSSPTTAARAIETLEYHFIAYHGQWNTEFTVK